MRKFFEGILPRLGFDEKLFEIKHHRGKEDLLNNLHKIIPSLSKRAKHIMVVIDQDKQDCVVLKNKINQQMIFRSDCTYTIRIACYELESWFLGDMAAIEQCSDRFKAQSFQNKDKYRHIDSIEKPSTVLTKIIPDWKKKHTSKPKFAETIASLISLEQNTNRSKSFLVLLDSLYSL
ncbi:MAG: DUF4276 family protein, partial [Bacteroidales bacterium]|nr:DUF4276 family protein [Bacteroidales bacterium]